MRTLLTAAALTLITLTVPACGKVDNAADTVKAVAIKPMGPLLNPNTISEDALSTVPGLTDGAAMMIIDKRPFATPTELHSLLESEMDADAIAESYKVMFVRINPNTASEADAMLVPSVLKPKHLAHEFEEYAPFTGIEHFRKEMGKYMDAPALADLERYVTFN